MLGCRAIKLGLEREYSGTVLVWVQSLASQMISSPPGVICKHKVRSKLQAPLDVAQNSKYKINKNKVTKKQAINCTRKVSTAVLIGTVFL